MRAMLQRKRTAKINYPGRKMDPSPLAQRGRGFSELPFHLPAAGALCASRNLRITRPASLPAPYPPNQDMKPPQSSARKPRRWATGSGKTLGRRRRALATPAQRTARIGARAWPSFPSRFLSGARLPTVLSWFAPPLDMTKDLYAVNRPIAFTFLDADGNEVGHRGAIIGKRLTLERDAGLSAGRLHRDGGPPLLRASRLRCARADARDLTQCARRALGRRRLHHHAADRQDRVHQPGAHAERASWRNCWTPPSSRNRCPRSRSWSFISTASIWAPAPMASTARRMSISTNRRRT